MYCNLVRIPQMLKVTPAMAAGVTSLLWEIDDIVDVIDAFGTTKRGAA